MNNRQLPPRRIAGQLRPRRKPICRRWRIDGILDVLAAERPWRALPKDFPHGKTAYQEVWQRRRHGLWSERPDRLRRTGRRAEPGRPTPSMVIIDTQSVRTISVRASNSCIRISMVIIKTQSVRTSQLRNPEGGYDAAKKLKRRKRPLAVDTLWDWFGPWWFMGPMSRIKTGSAGCWSNGKVSAVG
ncbi:MAG: hypothetical protein NZ602_04200 [Thermoguttaceae bacterium]|nr:hypothetical protein [Thermoguttaceae bacterium]MDW8037429.1 hypothetical protein [Thermoguttaceae bacterium]